MTSKAPETDEPTKFIFISYPTQSGLNLCDEFELEIYRNYCYKVDIFQIKTTVNI